MATTNRNESPDELKREIVRSREQLGREIIRFRDELDLPKKIRRSFQQKPAIWIGVMVFTGAGMVALLSRKRRSDGSNRTAPAPKSRLLQAGFILGALRIAANLVKPHVEQFLTEKLRRYRREQREK